MLSQMLWENESILLVLLLLLTLRFNVTPTVVLRALKIIANGVVGNNCFSMTNTKNFKDMTVSANAVDRK